MTLPLAGYLDAHAALVASGKLRITDLLDLLPWFRGAADWTAWRAFLCAAYGLEMTPAEYAIYQECTGRTDRPSEPAREVYVPTGRRGRKSAIGALMAVWAAAFRDHSAYLAPGERAMVPVLAKSKEDAKQIRAYAVAILSGPLAELLEDEPTTEEIRLRTRCDIRIRAATITAGRSRTSPLAILDEAAFFPTDDAAEPDVEIVRGIRPSQVMVPGAQLVLMSSPYARRGLLWSAYQEHYGKAGRALVWKAPTLRMHDTPQIRAEVEDEYRKDPVSAAAEYGAEFRTDVLAFIRAEALDACTVDGRRHLPAQPYVRYWGFVDPSGGSSDSYTLAIAHWDHSRRRGVLDLVREWRPPFDPEVVSVEVAQACKPYRVTGVTGDAYAGEWPRSRLKAHGLDYYVSQRPKSAIYTAWLPHLNAGRVELLDSPVLRAQLLSLDRRVSRGGRDSIDHPPGAHDDVANAVCGVLVQACDVGGTMAADVAPDVPKDLKEMRRREHVEWRRKHEAELLGKDKPALGSARYRMMR